MMRKGENTEGKEKGLSQSLEEHLGKGETMFETHWF